VAETAALTESALVIVVPEAEQAVNEWRMELDPSAALGVPAHITLLYPFARPVDITYSVVSTVARVVDRFRAFEFELHDVQWFGATVVWLAPRPSEPFIALTQALLEAFPEFPRYGGTVGDEVVPHLTVSDGAPLSRSKHAARTVAGALPIRSRAQDLVLLVGGRTPGSWRVSQSLPLA
jgi:hypothetical protein